MPTPFPEPRRTGMIEKMDVLFEIVIEFVLQVVVEFFGEVVLKGLDRLTGGRFRLRSLFWIYVLTVGLGFALGFGSLHVCGPLIMDLRLRIANLILTPLVVAGAMHAIGRLKERRGRTLTTLDKFLGAYLFALSFALARFAFAGV